MSGTKKRRVALIADTRGWCWWHQAEAVRKYAPPEIEVSVFESSITGDWAANPPPGAPFDAAIWFSWPECPTRKTTWAKRLITVLAHHGCQYDPWPCWKLKIDCDHQHEPWPAVAATNIRNRKEAARVFPKVDGVLAVNRELAAFAPTLGAKQTACIPAGVDCEFFRPTAPIRRDGKLRVGWCGQAVPGVPNTKGYDWVLLPVMERCRDFCEFVINGRDAKNALSPREMVRWYNRIDVLLITSISEGTPAPLLEAMACGRPVASTMVGDAPELKLKGVTPLLGYHDAATSQDTILTACGVLAYFAGDLSVVTKLGSRARTTVETHRQWRDLAPRWLSFALGDSRYE